MKVSAINLSNRLYSFKSQNNIENEKKTDEKSKISTSNVILGSAAIAATTAAIIFGIKYGKLNKNTKEVVESTKEKLQKDFTVVKEGSETILKLAKQDEDKLNKLSDKEINALLSDITKIDGSIVLKYKNKIEAPKLKEVSGLFQAKGVKTLNLPNLEKVGEDFALSALEEVQANKLNKVEGIVFIDSLKNTSFDNLESASSLLIFTSHGIKLNKLNKLTRKKNDCANLILDSSQNIEINNLQKSNGIFILSKDITMSKLKEGHIDLMDVLDINFPSFDKKNATTIDLKNEI